MRKLLLLFLLSGSLIGRAQDYSFPAVIHATKTALHKNFPGTALYVVPPAGFTFIPHQNRMVNDKLDQLIIKDWPGSDFYTNTAFYSREKVTSEGDKLLFYQDVKVNGYPGKIIMYREHQDSTRIVTRMVFGDKTFMASLLTETTLGDKAAMQRTKKCFASVYYDKSKKVSVFALEHFTVDTVSALFHLTDETSRSPLRGRIKTYWYELRQPIQFSLDTPYVKAMSVPILGAGGDSVIDIKDVALREFEKNGFGHLSYEHESTAKINGMLVYQAEVYGYYKEYEATKRLIFLYIAFPGEGKAAALVGVAFTDYPKWIAAFKELAGTIRKQ